MKINANIELEDIKKFSKEYNKNMDNKKIEKEIKSQFSAMGACVFPDKASASTWTRRKQR